MNDIVVRNAVVSDEPEILQLWDELSAYYLSLSPVLPLRWLRPAVPERRVGQLATLWNDPEHHAGFVAVSDASIIGFCRAELSPDGPAAASIHTLVVRETHRGKGTGRALMDSVIAWCERQGAEEVSLDVLPNNVKAAAFHRTFGFEPFITSYVKILRPQDGQGNAPQPCV